MIDKQYLEMYMMAARKKYSFVRLRAGQISEILKNDNLSQDKKLSMIAEITNQLDSFFPVSDCDMDLWLDDIESLGYEIPEIANSNESIILTVDKVEKSDNKQLS